MTTSEHGGYVFKAFAEASGTMALARLRGKVRQGLGQRFLIQDGSTVESEYEIGETRHESYGPGEFKVHDLENIGGEELVFTTVEFLKSANKPLKISEAIATAAE